MTCRHFDWALRRSLKAVAVGALAFSAVACSEGKTPREKSIGIWEFTGMDVTGRVVFRKDGKVINLFPENDTAGSPWIPTGGGKWWMDGNSIVTEVRGFAQKTEPPRLTRRTFAFTPNKLLSADGHSDFIRVTPAIARSSEVASILRGLVGLVIFVASIYAAAKSAFRRAFTVIGSGGMNLIVCSVLSVPKEFAQTGDVIISASTIRALQLPRDCFESAALLLVAGGLVWLSISLAGGRVNEKGSVPNGTG